MRNLWGGPCRMRFPLTVLRPCNLFGLSVPNVVAMHECVVPLRDHALAWYTSWDAHAHHHAGDSIETPRNFESGMGVLSSTSQFGTRGISPLQSLVFGKFRLSRSSRHAHHCEWLYSHFSDFGWFGWVARRCTKSSPCWTISCYGIILHFVIPLLVVWVTCTWNELETFFLLWWAIQAVRPMNGGLWNCSWKMWDDVTDECHRDSWMSPWLWSSLERFEISPHALAEKADWMTAFQIQHVMAVFHMSACPMCCFWFLCFSFCVLTVRNLEGRLLHLASKRVT